MTTTILPIGALVPSMSALPAASLTSPTTNLPAGSIPDIDTGPPPEPGDGLPYTLPFLAA